MSSQYVKFNWDGDKECLVPTKDTFESAVSNLSGSAYIAYKCTNSADDLNNIKSLINTNLAKEDITNYYFYIHGDLTFNDNFDDITISKNCNITLDFSSCNIAKVEDTNGYFYFSASSGNYSINIRIKNLCYICNNSLTNALFSFSGPTNSTINFLLENCNININDSNNNGNKEKTLCSTSNMFRLNININNSIICSDSSSVVLCNNNTITSDVNIKINAINSFFITKTEGKKIILDTTSGNSVKLEKATAYFNNCYFDTCFSLQNDNATSQTLYLNNCYLTNSTIATAVNANYLFLVDSSTETNVYITNCCFNASRDSIEQQGCTAIYTMYGSCNFYMNSCNVDCNINKTNGSITIFSNTNGKYIINNSYIVGNNNQSMTIKNNDLDSLQVSNCNFIGNIWISNQSSSIDYISFKNNVIESTAKQGYATVTAHFALILYTINANDKINNVVLKNNYFIGVVHPGCSNIINFIASNNYFSTVSEDDASANLYLESTNNIANITNAYITNNYLYNANKVKNRCYNIYINNANMKTNVLLNNNMFCISASNISDNSAKYIYNIWSSFDVKINNCYFEINLLDFMTAGLFANNIYINNTISDSDDSFKLSNSVLVVNGKNTNVDVNSQYEILNLQTDNIDFIIDDCRFEINEYVENSVNGKNISYSSAKDKIQINNCEFLLNCIGNGKDTTNIEYGSVTDIYLNECKFINKNATCIAAKSKIKNRHLSINGCYFKNQTKYDNDLLINTSQYLIKLSIVNSFTIKNCYLDVKSEILDIDEKCENFNLFSTYINYVVNPAKKSTLNVLEHLLQFPNSIKNIKLKNSNINCVIENSSSKKLSFSVLGLNVLDTDINVVIDNCNITLDNAAVNGNSDCINIQGQAGMLMGRLFFTMTNSIMKAVSRNNSNNTQAAHVVTTYLTPESSVYNFINNSFQSYIGYDTAGSTTTGFRSACLDLSNNIINIYCCCFAREKETGLYSNWDVYVDAGNPVTLKRLFVVGNLFSTSTIKLTGSILNPGEYISNNLYLPEFSNQVNVSF